MSLSLVLVLLAAMANLSHCIIITPPVYAGQVDFADILANTSPIDNLNELDETFSGSIGSNEPLPANTQDLLNGFSALDALENVPSGISDLINSFSQFGFKKGSMETADEQVQVIKMVGDNINSD